MASANLLEAILTDGIKDTHFFNGRVLTADDLRTMQLANQSHHAQLGRAVGDGVLYGFEVTLATNAPAGPESNATVHVAAGLAFNLAGEAAALRKGTDVRLTTAVDEETPEGRFTVCEPPAAEFTNIGFYILTVAPAEGLQGRAPMTELGVEGVAGKCASRYSVEGVKFRMFRVGLPAASTPLRGETRDLSTFVQFQLPTLGTAIS